MFPPLLSLPQGRTLQSTSYKKTSKHMQKIKDIKLTHLIKPNGGIGSM